MDKAVVLSAGLGTRMQQEDISIQLTEEQEVMASAGFKALIPINGRPFLDYSLNSLADTGYREICIVIGPAHTQLRNYYETSTCKRLTIEFAVEEKPLGSADALLAAERFAGDSQFLMINSDNYYPPEVLSSIRNLDGYGLVGFRADSLLRAGKATVEKIANCALLKVDDRGRLVDLIEKPDPEVLDEFPDPIWVSLTCWRFGRSIFEACRSIGISKRGEYELPDAVAWLINSPGEIFRMIPSDLMVFGLSSRANIGLVEERLARIEVSL